MHSSFSKISIILVALAAFLHAEEAVHSKGELSDAITAEFTQALMAIKVDGATIDKAKVLSGDLGNSFFTDAINDTLFKKVVSDAHRWCSGGNLGYFKMGSDSAQSIERFKIDVANIKRSLAISREYDEQDKETIAKIMAHIKKVDNKLEEIADSKEFSPEIKSNEQELINQFAKYLTIYDQDLPHNKDVAKGLLIKESLHSVRKMYEFAINGTFYDYFYFNSWRDRFHTISDGDVSAVVHGQFFDKDGRMKPRSGGNLVAYFMAAYGKIVDQTIK